MKKGQFVDSMISILLAKKVFTPERAKFVKEVFGKNSKETFDNFLLEEGFVDKADLLKALSEYYELPYFDPMGYSFEHQLLTIFPRAFLLRNKFIPIEVDEDILIIAAGEPDLPELLSQIGKYVSWNVQFRVGLTRYIRDSINEFYDKSPAEESEENMES